ncbi:hypothetical protein AB0K60_29935 [Thermopolyspora sp. NPDC052614]|uniref:hypothetical protein n=1 Tax=Thermopolyspora sp. NPDC052614 TaxID=3155682 RepID=UPI0034369422
MSTVNTAERDECDDGLGVALATITVEALALRADAHGRWSFRHLRTVPGPGESPDQAARRLAGIPADATHTVVHSTSWRYQPEGRIVLTYAICPDPRPCLPAIPLPELRVARGGGPAEPTPERLRPEHVAAHAVTHLALLLSTDPVVHDALAAAPHVAAALAGVATAPAGELRWWA